MYMHSVFFVLICNLCCTQNSLKQSTNCCKRSDVCAKSTTSSANSKINSYKHAKRNKYYEERVLDYIHSCFLIKSTTLSKSNEKSKGAAPSPCLRPMFEQNDAFSSPFWPTRVPTVSKYIFLIFSTR